MARPSARLGDASTSTVERGRREPIRPRPRHCRGRRSEAPATAAPAGATPAAGEHRNVDSNGSIERLHRPLFADLFPPSGRLGLRPRLRGSRLSIGPPSAYSAATRAPRRERSATPGSRPISSAGSRSSRRRSSRRAARRPLKLDRGVGQPPAPTAPPKLFPRRAVPQPCADDSARSSRSRLSTCPASCPQAYAIGETSTPAVTARGRFVAAAREVVAAEIVGVSRR